MNADEPVQIFARLEHDTELTYYREDSYSPQLQDFKGMTPDVMNRFMSSAQSGYTLRFRLTQKELSYTEPGHFVAAPDGIAVNINTSIPNNQKVAMPFTQMINSKIAAFYSPVELFGKLELKGRKSEILGILKKWIRLFLILPPLLQMGRHSYMATWEENYCLYVWPGMA